MDRKHKSCKRLYQPDEFKNLKEMLANTREKYGECAAHKFKTEIPGKLRIETYNQYIDNIEALGTALISIGLKDKRIAVISENRYEWALAYLAVITGVGVIVPLDRTLPEDEIISLMERSEVEAVFYSDKLSETMDKLKEEKTGKVKFYISMDADKTENGIYSQNELLELGRGLIKNGAKSFLEAKIDNEAMAVMLFTSGTTDKSKAVMLSHKNLATNIRDVASIFDVTKDDTFLSFLPLHHTYESTVGFLYPVSVGASIAYCEGLRHIADNLKEYEATAMISVPLLFESMYRKVMQGIEKKGKMKKVKAGLKISNALRKIGIDKRRKIFGEIYESLGGKIRLFVAGGAAFDPELEKGLNDLGIDTYQGYGLTETSPVISSEHKTCTRLGSVGQLLPSIEGTILEPNEQGIGELAIKGDIVMLGYYGNKKATDETIVDGWLRTGDLAYFDKDDFLFLTGRKKNVIVLKNGKNIYPEEVETMLNKIEGVKESFVFGKQDNENDENDLKIAAKIVYDPEVMKEKFNLEDKEEIKNKIWTEVKLVNKKMPTYKYVKEIIVTEEELTKTTTQKIKRFEEIKTIKS